MQPIKPPKIDVGKKTIIKGSRYLTIGLVFVLYIMADYIGGITNNTGIKSGLTYWIITIINLVLIIVIMLTVRSLRKDKKIQQSVDITRAMEQIQTGFNRITIKGLSSELDEYLELLNRKNKYETFLKAVRQRLLRYGNKDKYKKQREELNQLLKLSEDEVWELNFKYKPITVSKLFSALDGKIPNTNEFDVDTYEGRDVAKMVLTRSIVIIAFSAFTGLIIADFVFGGWSVLYSSLLKLFSLITAINTSMNVADDFVEHNLRTSVQRRLKYLAGFVNSKPELKTILKDKEEQE